MASSGFASSSSTPAAYPMGSLPTPADITAAALKAKEQTALLNAEENRPQITYILGVVKPTKSLPRNALRVNPPLANPVKGLTDVSPKKPDSCIVLKRQEKLERRKRALEAANWYSSEGSPAKKVKTGPSRLDMRLRKGRSVVERPEKSQKITNVKKQEQKNMRGLEPTMEAEEEQRKEEREALGRERKRVQKIIDTRIKRQEQERQKLVLEKEQLQQESRTLERQRGV